MHGNVHFVISQKIVIGEKQKLKNAVKIKENDENAGSLHLKSEWLPDETPTAVKNAKGKKKVVVKKEEGFEGEMIGDKRTGKCQ